MDNKKENNEEIIEEVYNKDDVIVIKKPKSLVATIVAILGLILTALGIILTEIMAPIITVGSVIVSLLTGVPFLSILFFLALPLVFLALAAVYFIFTLISGGGFIASIVSLILNSKKKSYFPTTASCINAPISFLYGFSSLKRTITFLTGAIIFIIIVLFAIIFIIVMFIAIMFDNSSTTYSLMTIASTIL